MPPAPNLKYLADFDGLKISALVKKIHTPFYLYSQKELLKNAEEFKKALPGALVCFAVKANSNMAVVKLFVQAGLGADITSTGELLLALACGVPADKIVFSGVGKTENGLNAAIKNQIRQINIESEEELEIINQTALELGKKANISVRVNPDVDAKTHKKITTGTSKDKFGIPWARAFKMYKRAAKMQGVKIVGISVHIGSQITDIKPYDKAYALLAKMVAALEAQGINLQNINLGGGLGIVYNYKKDKALPLAAYSAVLKKHFARFGKNIIVEPGRRLVGEAGVLISKVLYNKKGEGRNFVIIDAGMNDLIRPAMYDAWHEILPCAAPPPNAVYKKFDVVGPVCESADTFARARALPPLKRGDCVAIMCAGAYGNSMSSNYNLHPVTGEVLTTGHGKYRIVRRRKPYAKILRELAADI